MIEPSILSCCCEWMCYYASPVYMMIRSTSKYRVTDTAVVAPKTCDTSSCGRRGSTSSSGSSGSRSSTKAALQSEHAHLVQLGDVSLRLVLDLGQLRTEGLRLMCVSRGNGRVYKKQSVKTTCMSCSTHRSCQCTAAVSLQGQHRGPRHLV